MSEAGVPIPEPLVLKEHLRSWSTIRNDDKAWVIKNMEYAKVAIHRSNWIFTSPVGQSRRD